MSRNKYAFLALSPIWTIIQTFCFIGGVCMQSEILIPQLLNNLDNTTVTIVNPKGQNKGNAKEKLEQKGYTVAHKSL